MDDTRLRLAAFRFLEEQLQLASDDGVLSRKVLEQGFTYEGQRVRIMGPRGIFKPRVLREIPLSITTVPIRHVIGITPDYIVQVRRDVLEQEDGPMLIHGLQGFHGKLLRLPTRETWRPDPHLLEERYSRFRSLAG